MKSRILIGVIILLVAAVYSHAGFMDDLKKAADDLQKRAVKIETPTDKEKVEKKDNTYTPQKTGVYFYLDTPKNNSKEEQQILNYIDEAMDTLDQGKRARSSRLRRIDGLLGPVARNYVRTHGFANLWELNDVSKLEKTFTKWQTGSKGLSLAPLHGILEVVTRMQQMNLTISYDFGNFMNAVNDLYNDALKKHDRGVRRLSSDLVRNAILKLEFVKPYKDSHKLLGKYHAEYNQIVKKERNKKKADLVASGDRLFQDGKNEQAIKSYEKAFELSPEGDKSISGKIVEARKKDFEQKKRLKDLEAKQRAEKAKQLQIAKQSIPTGSVVKGEEATVTKNISRVSQSASPVTGTPTKVAATFKYLPISRGEVLSIYSPQPDKIGSENTAKGTAIDSYSGKFHTLELESHNGQLIRTSLKYSMLNMKADMRAGLSFVLVARVFSQKIAGIVLGNDPNELDKLGLNDIYSPGPDELINNGVKLRRYTKGGVLIFEAIAD